MLSGFSLVSIAGLSINLQTSECGYGIFVGSVRQVAFWLGSAGNNFGPRPKLPACSLTETLKENDYVGDFVPFVRWFERESQSTSQAVAGFPSKGTRPTDQGANVKRSPVFGHASDH